MTDGPLFDREILLLRRTRAQKDSLFLHRAARTEAEDRIALVNRAFTDPAIVSPFPDLWDGFAPSQTLVEDTPVLEFAPGGHDLVVHAMCLHWSADPVGDLIQCRRALRPDGLLLVICLGGRTLTELRAVLGEAEITETGGLSPRIAPMAEIRDLGALLQRAGLTLPVADSAVFDVQYRDIFHLMHDLRGMAETNALTARLRHPTRRGIFARAAALYSAHFPGSNGGLRASFEIIALTGWAPEPSQPQPLRPGSAQQRLAAALGSTENPLRD